MEPPDIYAEARKQRVRETSSTPRQFAIETRASEGFCPKHIAEWESFWQHDICEKDQHHTAFPYMSLTDSRRVWLAMEDKFFDVYEMFIRVAPEWSSSGIWSPRYPGARSYGPMVPYNYFNIPPDLEARFQEWQDEFDAHEPWAPEKFDWERNRQTGDALARDLKVVLGPKIYVEHRSLMEVLADGSVVSYRPWLGLPGT